MVIPREHGAWGLLFVPLVTGATVGIHTIAGAAAVLLFAVAALSLFWLRTPVESWIGAGPLRAQSGEEVRFVITTAAILSSVSAICLTALFWGGNRFELLVLGGFAALAFAIQAGLKLLGRRYYMAAQIIGALGLTATAPAAYFVATGHLNATAVALWLTNWAFAGNQIHFVQLRIHGARLSEGREKLRNGRTFFLGQLAMVAALATAWRFELLPALAILAFVPALVRGFAWFVPGQKPLQVKRLGWTELVHGITFGALLILAFLL
jgi:hypothetical protein